jgi:hypothetical protein
MFTSNLTQQQGKAGAIKPYCCSLHPTFIIPLSAATNYQRGSSSEVSDNAVPWKYQILVWSLKCSWNLKSLVFFSIHFISIIFTCLFNINLFCLDNF